MTARDWVEDEDYGQNPNMRLRLVRVPVAEEIWTTLDGRKLAVADMSEDHVRNALRHVIWRSRYAWLFKQMRTMEGMRDNEIDAYAEVVIR